MSHRSRRLALLALLGLPLAALPSSAAALEFSAPAMTPLAGMPTGAVVADADLDGDLDVAVVTADAGAGQLTLLLNDGSGSFPESAVASLGVGTPGAVTAGELLGGGRPELVVSGPERAEVTWFTYAGLAGFVGRTVPLPGTRPGAVGLGDFSGDGLVDAVVTDDTAPGYVRLLRGDGSTLQPSPPPVHVGDYPESIAVADFDEDSRPDFATADTGTLNVTVALADGLGSFTPAPGSPQFVGSQPNAIVTADFDGDGHADLATANRGSNTIAVLLGDGDGGFADAPGSPLAVGNQPASLATGDFNGDGHVDLATVGGTRLTVLLGDGDGHFAPAVGSPYAVGGNPIGLIVGDVDGDGLDDLLAQRASGTALATLRNVSAKPANTAPPQLSGDGRVGATLTCADGAWSGSAPLVYTRAWLRDGVPVAGASGAAYVVGDDDRGASLRCAVTATNELGATTAQSAPVDVPERPAVALGAVSAVTATSATVSGLVTPSLAATSWRFEYGPSEQYGSGTPDATVPAGRVPQAVSAAFEGLQPRTTYHLRLVAKNAAGTTASADMTFTTADAPPPPGGGGGDRPAPGGDAAPPAVRVTTQPPALGRGRDVTLAFAADGAAGHECRLDRGPWIACGSPFAVRGLRAGDHTLAVRAIGRDGQRGSATTVSFQVNPYPPGLTIPRTVLRADGAAAALGLTCSRREGEGRGACAGTVTVRPARGATALARGAFRVRAGASGSARLRLTPAGRRALRAASAGLPVRIAIRARDLAGNRRTLTLRGTLRPLSARAPRSRR